MDPASLILLLGLATLAFVVGLEFRAGWSVLTLILLLGSLCLYPKSLSTDPNPAHVGISQSVPGFATYTVVLIAITYFLVLRLLYRPAPFQLPVSALIFLLFLGIGLGAIWKGSSEQLAGALQLTLGYCAWFVGGQLGPEVLRSRERVRWIAYFILAVVTIETVIAILQRAGFSIHPTNSTTAALVGSRVNGTTDHPDNLGKILFLLLILCLGLFGTADTRTRRVLWVSIGLMFIPLGLSEGRANIVAAVGTVLIWALLARRQGSAALRIAVPIVVILVALPFVGSIATRFQEDPNGGPRQELSASAIEQIHRAPWGVGPNSYVSVVSAYNPITAQGYPVHNTFLLTAAELGLLGAVLFWIPVLGLLIACWPARRTDGFRGSFAIAVACSAPGLYIINATGWGILSAQLLPLWFLVYGIAYSQVRSKPKPRLESHAEAGVPLPAASGGGF